MYQSFPSLNDKYLLVFECYDVQVVPLITLLGAVAVKKYAG